MEKACTTSDKSLKIRKNEINITGYLSDSGGYVHIHYSDICN